MYKTLDIEIPENYSKKKNSNIPLFVFVLKKNLELNSECKELSV